MKRRKLIYMAVEDEQGYALPPRILEDMESLVRMIRDDALTRLERAPISGAKVAELRFFGGLHGQDVADIPGVSVNTVKRDWKVAGAPLDSECV